MQENQFQRFENLLEEFKQYIERVQGELKKFNVASTEVDVLEFEGKQYRRVNRLARPGDVVIFRVNRTREIYSTVNKPYRVERYRYDGKPVFVNGTGRENLVYNDIHDRTTDTVEVYEPIQEEKSPNQLRKEIIEKAKEFVENILGEYETFRITIGKYKNQNVRAVFRVNTNKRAVTALIYGAFSKELVFKGIAKCHPDDVFNEHIGKAIALGRALGLDVSEFENAVQPTITIGQIVVSDIGTEYKVCSLENVVGNVKFRDSKGNLQDAIGGYLPDEKWYKIIDDTNAIYEEVN